MRGARRVFIVLSIAVIAAPIGLFAQEAKSSTTLKSSPGTAKEPVQSGDLNRDTAFSLLSEAYNSSRDLPSEERIPLLSEVCDISASMKHSASPGTAGFRSARVRASRGKPAADLTKKQNNKLRDWAEELFQLGNEFPSDSQLRSQAEISAARCMVSIDPKRAMELLDSLETGPATNGRYSPWGVVSALFIRLYDTEGAAAFPDIRREALSLGDRGMYPDFAILNLLQKVHDRPDVTRQFFADAIDYFRRSATNQPKVYGLMSLLASDQIRKQLRPWQVQDAAAQVVASVKDYLHSQSDQQSDGRPVDSNIRLLLQFVTSSMEKFAPETAAQLPNPATLSFAEGGYFLSVTANARRKMPQDPLPDDSMVTLQKEFEKSRTAMMKLAEDGVHEGPEMQQTIDRTVGLGVEWVERRVQGYAPEYRAYAMMLSTPELEGAVRLGAHINPAATLVSIRQIQDDELRTRLLLAVAETVEYMR